MTPEFWRSLVTLLPTNHCPIYISLAWKQLQVLAYLFIGWLLDLTKRYHCGEFAWYFAMGDCTQQ